MKYLVNVIRKDVSVGLVEDDYIRIQEGEQRQRVEQ